MPQDMKMVLAKAGLTPQEAGRLGKGVKHSFALNRNRFCTRYCPLWEDCWMKPLSKIRHNGKCALANMDDISKQRALNLVTGGKSGVSKNINDLFVSIEQDVNKIDLESGKEGKPKTYEKMALLDKYMKWYDMLYGKEKEKVVNTSAINELKKIQNVFNVKDNTKEKIETTEQYDGEGNLIKSQVTSTTETKENVWDVEGVEKPTMGEIIVANKKGFWQKARSAKAVKLSAEQGHQQNQDEPDEHTEPRDDKSDDVLSVT
jgi:hypothetical protein